MTGELLHAVTYDDEAGTVNHQWSRREATGLWTIIDGSGQIVADSLDEANMRAHLQRYGAADIAAPLLAPGEYHPRLWRRHFCPDPHMVHRRERIMSINAAENLFAELKDVARCVEPVPANWGTFGHRIRELLILTATEVESAWKAVLAANGVSRERMSTNDYVRLAGPMRLAEWRVTLSLHPDVPELSPFARWSPSEPTESLPWYAAYNAAKHGREQNFERATLEHMLNAMAAVFVMVSAQFGIFSRRRHPSLEHEDQHNAEPWTGHFMRVQSPPWNAAEAYVPPGLGDEAALWEASWQPRPLFPAG